MPNISYHTMVHKEESYIKEHLNNIKRYFGENNRQFI